MRVIAGTISLSALAVCLLAAGSRAGAQAPARSSVVIPLKKEKAPPGRVITVHDTVTMVRIDTVRVVETILKTDTLFRVDTVRDSCSRAVIPIPIPIPLPISHHTERQPATLDPGIPTSVTPEPATFVMVGTGLAAIVGFSRYKRRK